MTLVAVLMQFLPLEDERNNALKNVEACSGCIEINNK
jgi:hypothetical protein